MNSKYAKSRLDYLDSLFHDFEVQELDEYTKSHIAKYLTVLASGLYEDIIRNFIIELAQRETMRKEIKQFIFTQIVFSFQNPKFENLERFLNRFNKEWIRQLKDRIDGKNMDALNTIVNNKNLIAHGESSTITFSSIQQHYLDSKVILIELDDIILKSI